MASVYGNNFGTDKAAITVTVGGKAAYIFGIVNTQANVEIPIELAPGPTTITVSRAGAVSAPFNAILDRFSPALLTTNGNASLFLADTFTPRPVVSPGDFVVTYATGLGQTTPPVATGMPAPVNPLAFCATPPQATVGDLPAQVTCVAAPGFIASFQLNIRIPTAAKPGPQKLVVSSGGIAGPGANVTVTSEGLVLSQTGLTFQALQGGANVPAKTFQVVGDPLLLNFTVGTSTVSGGSWLQATPSGSIVSVTVDPTGLDPGEYYGLVSVTSPAVANSPQSTSVVLRVAAPEVPPTPVVEPDGLLFVDAPGDASPATQSFAITNLTAAPIGIGLTLDAVPAPWFTLTASGDMVTADQPVSVTVQPNPNLAEGIYTGSITAAFSDGSTRVVSLAEVIAAGATANSSAIHRAASGCTAKKLVPLFTVLGANFSGPAGWPAPVEVLVVDDCGTVLTDGAVLVSFSSGDPTLQLTHVGNGRWTGTWTPRTAVDGVKVSATATNGGIFGQVTITGGVPANPNVPVVSPGGVVGLAGFDAVPAPGTLVAIQGTSLSDGSYQAAGLPLDTQLGPTQALLNGRTLPLVSTTENQVAAILPYDLAANTKYMLIVRRGNSLSVPEPVAVTDTQPAIFTADNSGQGQGQIYDNQVLADPQAPASAGDMVAIYCAGLGLVDPAVDAGSAPPDGTPVSTVTTVTATIGGLDAPVASASLAPGMAGVYIVSATVPDGVAPGDQLPVMLTAGARSSRQVTMAVE